jgi:glycosyltransferase involved in cell wall biosynthesis
MVALRLSALARRLSAKLVVSNHAELGPFADAAARLNGLPWVCFLRQADRPPRYYEKYRVAKADAVAAVSRAALQSYRSYLCARYLPSNPMQVIPTGIAMPQAGRAENQRSSTAGARPPIVGTVGLRPVKRPELFLEILVRLRRSSPQVRGLFVGGASDQDFDRLRSRARGAGLEEAVIFAGQQASMDRWYRQMDVYAHTSRSEALPKAVLEAMSHSLPVVAFDVGGIGEAVQDGVTGFLCSEQDLDAHAAALERLLLDRALSSRMGEAGASRIRELFSPATMAGQVTTLFEEVLKSRDPRGWPEKAEGPEPVQGGRGSTESAK